MLVNIMVFWNITDFIDKSDNDWLISTSYPGGCHVNGTNIRNGLDAWQNEFDPGTFNIGVNIYNKHNIKEHSDWKIYEILIFDIILSEYQLKCIENYLSQEHSLPIPSYSIKSTIHPTKTCPPIMNHFSDFPTQQPTNTPTVIPTLNPSLHPTNKTSIQPTHQPSNIPSTTPSKSPSTKSTNNPTYNPSISSLQPLVTQSSNSPSTIPSITPSITPSNTPSNSPILLPTKTPSNYPTTNNPSITTLNTSQTSIFKPLTFFIVASSGIACCICCVISGIISIITLKKRNDSTKTILARHSFDTTNELHTYNQQTIPLPPVIPQPTLGNNITEYIYSENYDSEGVIARPSNITPHN